MIPLHIITAYVERYPHLRHIAREPRLFAQAACRVAVPRGVTTLEVYHLAGVAEGISWPTSNVAT